MNQKQSSYEDRLISLIKTPQDLSEICLQGISSDSFLIRPEIFDFISHYCEKYNQIPSPVIVEGEFQSFKYLDVLDEEQKYLIDNLREVETKRKIIEIIEKSKDRLGENVYEGLDYLISTLSQIRKIDEQSISYTDKDAMQRFEKFEERKEKHSKGITIGLRTGISFFDEALLGWFSGDLIAIIANSTVGKSFLAMYLACFTYVFEESKVLFFSPEMNLLKTELRFDAVMGHLKGYKLSNMNLHKGSENKEEYKKFLEEMSKNKRWKTMCSDRGKPFTIPAIQRHITEYSPDVVVIDGFLLLDVGQKSWDTLMNAANALKSVALSKNIVLIVTSQASANSQYELPEMFEIFGSKAVAHSSDVLIMMADNENKPNSRWATIRKNRDGEVKNKPFEIHFDVDVGDIGI